MTEDVSECSERGQRRGRRSPWMLALLVAGVICTVGYNMVGSMQQLKADNRHLRRELAIKEQVVSNLAFTLKAVNRHHNSHFQAVENHWRSAQSGGHRQGGPVKVWTFDGARW